MKRFWMLLALAVVLVLPTLASADTPSFVDEAEYPAFSRPLTAVEQAHLGLKPRILRHPLEVLNRRGPSDYRFDRLEPGDVVLEDETGTPRYRAACGNRIEAFYFPPMPLAEICEQYVESKKFADSVMSVTVPYGGHELGHNLATDHEFPWWKRVWEFWKFVAAGTLFVLLVALTIGIGIEMARWIRERRAPTIPDEPEEEGNLLFFPGGVEWGEDVPVHITVERGGPGGETRLAIVLNPPGPEESA